MKFIIATSITLFLAPILPSTAAPAPADAAQPASATASTVVPIDMPRTDVECLGYTVSGDNIQKALVQGWGWASNIPPIQMGYNKFPHELRPVDTLTFSNCAGSQLWEYPVVRYATNPWVPTSRRTRLPTGPNGEKEPDRVIFTFVAGASAPTYCGTVTHDSRQLTGAGNPGAFVMCTA